MTIRISKLKIDEYLCEDEVPLRPSVREFIFTTTGEVDLAHSKETLIRLGYKNIDFLDSTKLFSKLSPNFHIVVPYAKVYDILSKKLTKTDFDQFTCSLKASNELNFTFPELSDSDKTFVLEEIRKSFIEEEKALFDLAKIGELTINDLIFHTPKLSLELAKTDEYVLISNPEANEEIYLTTFLNHYVMKNKKISYDGSLDFIVVFQLDDKEKKEIKEIYGRMLGANFLTDEPDVKKLSYRFIRSLLSRKKIQVNESPYHVLEQLYYH